MQPSQNYITFNFHLPLSGYVQQVAWLNQTTKAVLTLKFMLAGSVQQAAWQMHTIEAGLNFQLCTCW
jgi:hypothetical protein